MTDSAHEPDFYGSITVSVMRDSVPVKDVWVRVTLRTSRRQDFSFLVGPSKSDGSVRITREDLIEQSERAREMFPMDHTGLGDWDGIVVVEIPSASEVHKLLESASRWPDLVSYDRNERASLSTHMATLAGGDGYPHLVVSTVEFPPHRVIVKGGDEE